MISINKKRKSSFILISNYSLPDLSISKIKLSNTPLWSLPADIVTSSLLTVNSILIKITKLHNYNSHKPFLIKCIINSILSLSNKCLKNLKLNPKRLSIIGIKSLLTLSQDIMVLFLKKSNKNGLMIKVPGLNNGNLITKN